MNWFFEGYEMFVIFAFVIGLAVTVYYTLINPLGNGGIAAGGG